MGTGPAPPTKRRACTPSDSASIHRRTKCARSAAFSACLQTLSFTVATPHWRRRVRRGKGPCVGLAWTAQPAASQLRPRRRGSPAEGASRLRASPADANSGAWPPEACRAAQRRRAQITPRARAAIRAHWMPRAFPSAAAGLQRRCAINGRVAHSLTATTVQPRSRSAPPAAAECSSATLRPKSASSSRT
jgi:hypothetical protein